MRVELGQPFGDLGTIMQIDLYGEEVYVIVEGDTGHLIEVNVTELLDPEQEEVFA